MKLLIIWVLDCFWIWYFLLIFWECILIGWGWYIILEVYFWNVWVIIVFRSWWLIFGKKFLLLLVGFWCKYSGWEFKLSKVYFLYEIRVVVELKVDDFVCFCCKIFLVWVELIDWLLWISWILLLWV